MRDDAKILNNGSWTNCNTLITQSHKLLTKIVNSEETYSINILYQKVKGSIKRVESNEVITLVNGVIIQTTDKSLLPQILLINMVKLVRVLIDTEVTDTKDKFKILNDILTLKAVYVYLCFGIEFNKKFYRDMFTNINPCELDIFLESYCCALEYILRDEHKLEVSYGTFGIGITYVEK